MVHFILSPFVNFLYKNFTACVYPSVHSLQYPNSPSIFLISFFEEGRRSDKIFAILLGFSLWLSLFIKCPRYFTSDSTNCSFLFDNLNFFPKKSSFIVASLASASLDNKRFGDSANSCGNFVHFSCCFLPVSEFSHSKAKIF